MRKSFLLFLTLVLITPLFAAQMQKEKDLKLLSEKYEQRAYSQKKTANILLISGAGLTAAGSLLLLTNKQEAGVYSIFSTQSIAGILMITGGFTSGITSIPFYISAHHNKNKSLKVSPMTGFIQTNSLTEPKSYPSAGLKVTF